MFNATEIEIEKLIALVDSQLAMINDQDIIVNDYMRGMANGLITAKNIFFIVQQDPVPRVDN